MLSSPVWLGSGRHTVWFSYPPRRTVLEDFELRYVTRLLAGAGGNVAAAARQAQTDRTYLIKLVQRHGLRTR
jgi:transcriptional regulator with GAF, ATPase, and Fis domain